MHNKKSDNSLDDNRFYDFLVKITGFIWAYAITNPGVNALRTPVYSEMINIIEDKDVQFVEWKFNAEVLKSMIDNFAFTNNRTITKSMLTWWAFNYDNQPLLDVDTVVEIEHIYARKRQENSNELSDVQNLELLGNKSLLEKKINIRASDYRFDDKKKYYKGFTNVKGQTRDGTGIIELLDLTSSSTDFTETDIINRYDDMMNHFINYLKTNDLLQ
jgi:hypothetical protein